MQEHYAHPEMKTVQLADVLHALSDPLRLRIVAALATGDERGWGDFDAPVAPSTLSHHMKVLRQAGLVTHRREGTRCIVALRPELEARFPGLLDTVLRLAPERAAADRTGGE
ncbi:MAG TPA: metalloregulator ArsR/SmtB family transcription factor [Roseomonas sp.]|nr:metalloregulator ArsR/SmtB family transcription factor [Roseomonas sp.]